MLLYFSTTLYLSSVVLYLPLVSLISSAHLSVPLLHFLTPQTQFHGTWTLCPAVKLKIDLLSLLEGKKNIQNDSCFECAPSSKRIGHQ